MREHIVGNRHQCVFFAEHASVFTDEGQAVYVWIYYDAKIETAGAHLVHDGSEVFLQRFWVVGKVAGGFTEKELVAYA